MARTRVTIERVVEINADSWAGEGLIIRTCYSCGSPIALTTDHERRARASQAVNFVCSKGHSQVFTETTETRLRQELEEAQTRNTNLRQSLTEKEEMLKATEQRNVNLQKRVRAGVCPHCQRTFQQLARHMVSKHSP